jgi:hypothetical protein
MANTILIVDAVTNEVIEREMNAEEKAAHKALCEATKAYETQANAKTVARESALAKLTKLGLTADEIAAL